jgi:hypothetical protein
MYRKAFSHFQWMARQKNVGRIRRKRTTFIIGCIFSVLNELKATILTATSKERMSLVLVYILAVL